MIDFIYKPTTSRIWRWKFRQSPQDGKIQDSSLKTSDKQVAEKRHSELLRERQHERDGLMLSKPLRDGAQRRVSGHLEDFLGDMRRRGKSEKYLANLQFRVGALIPGCGWNTAKDVTADSFQSWRRGQVELSAKTANDYLEAARCFFNWLIKNGRGSDKSVGLGRKSQDGRPGNPPASCIQWRGNAPASGGGTGRSQGGLPDGRAYRPAPVGTGRVQVGRCFLGCRHAICPGASVYHQKRQACGDAAPSGGGGCVAGAERCQWAGGTGFQAISED